jgi:hypothetical protein
MEKEIKDLLVSTGLYGIGTYTRFLFGGKKYTMAQKIALVLFGLGVLVIVNYMQLDRIYSTLIGLVTGVWSPNIVGILIKTGNKSEEPISDKLSDKIDKIL